ncbi:MAG: DapH/DapD/GlmU-related protein [Ignavibacteriaceae bacterium]
MILNIKYFIKLFKKLRDIYLVKIKWRNYHIDKNFHAGRGVNLWARNNIIIGKNFYIGRYSLIECDAIIGDDVIIANYVALIGKYDHNYHQIGISMRLASNIKSKDYNWKGLKSRIIIEDDVWIGYGAIIMSGVTIKTGSIIAAGSVVTKDIEPYSIYGGNPARKIGDRFNTPKDLEKHKVYYLSHK